MTVALILVVLAVGTANGFVTVQVLRNREYGLREKAVQLAFVWLLPIVGALIAFHILREAHDTGRAGAYASEEAGVRPLASGGAQPSVRAERRAAAPLGTRRALRAGARSTETLERWQ